MAAAAFCPSTSLFRSLRPCPHCNGGERRPCEYCGEDKFISVDRVGETYLIWLKERIGTKDTDPDLGPDRKSTRLNSSHVEISYAVFCLKKKKKAEQAK